LPEGHGSLFLKRSDGNGSQFGGLANGFHVSGRSIYHGGLMIAGVSEARRFSRIRAGAAETTDAEFGVLGYRLPKTRTRGAFFQMNYMPGSGSSARQLAMVSAQFYTE
jgi:hypothetical protein